MPEKIYTTKRNLEKQDEKEIVFEEVAELELPIKIIIEKIKSRIENGEYGLIIGDDASGRIPTLILGNFIKKVSEQKGLDRPNIIFIPGKLEMERESYWRKIFGLENTSKTKQAEELDEYILGQGASKEKRILVITDTIKTGDSLKTLVNLLRRAGYVCDIATIGIEPVIIGQGMRASLKGVDIIFGKYRDKSRKENENTPLIYRKESEKLTGVYKRPGDKTSKTLKSSALPEGVDLEDVNPESINTHSSRQEIQDSINKARKDASVVTDHLIDWYNSQEQNEK